MPTKTAANSSAISGMPTIVIASKIATGRIAIDGHDADEGRDSGMTFDAVEREPHAHRKEQEHEQHDRARAELQQQVLVLIRERIERRGVQEPRCERARGVGGDAVRLAVDLGAFLDVAAPEERVHVAADVSRDVGVAEDHVEVAVDDFIRRDRHVVEEHGLVVIADRARSRPAVKSPRTSERRVRR